MTAYSNDDQIIETARLMHAVDRGERPEDALQQALDALGDSDLTAVVLAGKMIEGLPYRIVTDNPEAVRRARSIVQLLGGVVTSAETDGRLMTTIRFDPPRRQ